MDILVLFLDFVLHIDKHLMGFVQSHGDWVYALLFVIVFVETGLVVMPLLPGDSLLFMVGAMAGLNLLSLPLVMLLLVIAAVAGDTLNYHIGRAIGHRVFAWEDSRWFNRKAFDQAHAFYEKYGGPTIIAARFLPFIRTFAPFVAGVAEMTYRRFLLYNVVGGVLWVVSLCLVGFFFGNLPFVREHLEKIIWALLLGPGLVVIGASLKAKYFPVAPPQTRL